MKSENFDVVVVTVCGGALAGVLLGALIVSMLRGRLAGEESRGASATPELWDTGWVEMPPVDLFAGVDRSGQHGVCEFCGKLLDGGELWHECEVEVGDD